MAFCSRGTGGIEKKPKKIMAQKKQPKKKRYRTVAGVFFFERNRIGTTGKKERKLDGSAVR